MMTYERLVRVYKRDGFSLFFKKIQSIVTKKIEDFFISIPAIVIVILIRAISPWIRIQFFRLFSDRIGHYANNTEILLATFEFSAFAPKKKTYTFFYTVPGAPLCNKFIHKMWKRTIPILPFPKLISKIDQYLLRFDKEYRTDPIKNYFEFGDGCDRWNLPSKRKTSYASFTENEKKRGIKELEKMGVPPDGKFVCLLVRDSCYLNAVKPEIDWSYQDYRDASIKHYREVAKHLSDLGYYVIRMGKHVKEVFDFDYPRVIDYADSVFHNDFMDIYLSAHCLFFLSTATGLDSVSQMFKKPVVVTNFVLANRGLWPDWKLLIPKKILDTRNNRFLTFKETYQIFQNGGYNVIEKAKKHGLLFVENTPEDIIEVVDEMLGRINGTWQYSKEDEYLQNIFWEDYPDRFSDIPPFLTVPVLDLKKMPSYNAIRIGSIYLRKNKFLLEN
jgi:putative glycosyltransferase (TIGR04372 family)